MTLGINGYNGTLSSGLGGVQVLKPDGSVFNDCGGGFTGAGAVCRIDDTLLPVTGTYSILVMPGGTNTGQATFTLSNVLTGPTLLATATTPTTVSLSRPGQYIYLTFDGKAGQMVNLAWSGATANPAQTYLNILGPGHVDNGGVNGIGLSNPTGVLRVTLQQSGIQIVQVAVVQNVAVGSLGLRVTIP